MLTGVFAAVMVGAILVVGTSALFSIGQAHINPQGSEQQMVRAASFNCDHGDADCPILAGQDSIFKYLQKMNGIYFYPNFRSRGGSA